MNWLHFLFNILRNRQGYLIVGIVSVDLLTKILAYNFLDANEIINDDALLQTVLALNSNGLGSSGEAYVVKYGSDSLLTNAMIFLLFSLAVPILACIGKLTVWRLLLATVVVVTMSYILISLIKPNLGFQQKVLAIRVSHIFIWFTIWVYSTAWVWKLGSAMFFSVALGNGLSLFYPPYKIVDFIWSSPINQLFGLEVFNIADLVWLVGTAVFVVAAFCQAYTWFLKWRE